MKRPVLSLARGSGASEPAEPAPSWVEEELTAEEAARRGRAAIEAGQSADHDEVKAWMDRWGEEDCGPPPGRTTG